MGAAAMGAAAMGAAAMGAAAMGAAAFSFREHTFFLCRSRLPAVLYAWPHSVQRLPVARIRVSPRSMHGNFLAIWRVSPCACAKIIPHRVQLCILLIFLLR